MCKNEAFALTHWEAAFLTGKWTGLDLTEEILLWASFATYYIKKHVDFCFVLYYSRWSVIWSWIKIWLKSALQFWNLSGKRNGIGKRGRKTSRLLWVLWGLRRIRIISLHHRKKGGIEKRSDKNEQMRRRQSDGEDESDVKTGIECGAEGDMGRSFKSCMWLDCRFGCDCLCLSEGICVQPMCTCMYVWLCGVAGWGGGGGQRAGEGETWYK